MVSADDDNKMRPRKADNGNTSTGSANVGEALRAVYRDAAAEMIPDEMLDLLNKLA